MSKKYPLINMNLVRTGFCIQREGCYTIWKSSESYHDYMLELFELFNQAYPQWNPLSPSQRISKWFVLGIGDQNLAYYLADQSYSGPMELVKLAESLSLYGVAKCKSDKSKSHRCKWTSKNPRRNPGGCSTGHLCPQRGKQVEHLMASGAEALFPPLTYQPCNLLFSINSCTIYLYELLSQ